MGKNQPQQRTEWISASDVGRTVFCPHSVALKYQGAKPTKQAVLARQQGDLKHEALNRQARQDKRCYVASYLYGVDDPRTNVLRKFRDDAILKWPGGALLVMLYYRLSPLAIHLSQSSPRIAGIVRFLVDRLVCWCSRRGNQS